MMRLNMIVLAKDERTALKALGRLGVMHLTQTRSGSDTAPLAPIDRTGELVRYDRIRVRIQELRKSLKITSLSREFGPAEQGAAKRNDQSLFSSYSGQEGEPGAPTAVDRSLMLVEGAALPAGGQAQVPLIDQAEEGLRSMEQQSAELLGNYQRLIQRQRDLTVLSERVSCYRGLEIPLDGLDQFSFLHFVTGNIPAQNLESLIKEVGNNVALLPLAQYKGQQPLFAVTTRQGGPALERALEQVGFQHEKLPVVEGVTVDRLSEEGEREGEQLTAELEQLKGKLKEMAARFTLPLAKIEEFMDTEYRLLDASQKFPRTEAVVLITGWAPAVDAGVLEQRLREITGGRYVLQASLPDGSTKEQPPILLRHSRLLRPFEMLVSTYGLPNYQELEPTLFVAFSYIVMFGMMFGDAGHGMVLAICGLVALFARRSQKVRDFGVLLIFGGSSSIIFGVVYGSYFGVEALKKYALWHDPLEGDPMSLMYGAIGIGIVVISLGLILNVINRFRRGDIIGAILDKFGLAGVLFYWGILALLVNGAAIRSWGLMGVSIVLFLVVPVVGWSVKEPLEHLLRHETGERGEANGGLAGAFIESCVGAFEAVLSYLANTISFVRLAAYAMSHAALLFAAFMLAAVVKDISFGGGLWSLLVIILGNLAAIALEGIIASVQALRLEYYEFFGKFYSGSGRPFEPFRLTANSKD